ncbi:MAG: DUF1080 domain-containing protein [Cyclobacteriaceae bacterium]|nr:DUF1080 domain-containing protein [Cyclobacteriaceae bacterium]MDW8332432.1 DUF1080 domain-containing protein [Cyclobacteriaceae bacterium]
MQRILLLLLLLTACQKKGADRSEFPALFNGKDLTGWKIYRNLPNNSWEVTNGMLHCKPFSDTEENLRSHLMTTNTYSDFELSFEWKISEQGNSGILFRVSENEPEPHYTGPEYQLLDDEHYPGDVPDNRKTASCFDLYAAEGKVLNPAGQWNSGKIVAQGNSIRYWLNGKEVLHYEIGSPDWNERITKSKWKDFPLFATFTRGHIVLQDHGNEVWFRNLYLTELK